MERVFGKFMSLARFDNTDWLVEDVSVWKAKHDYKCGEVVLRGNREVVLAAQDGFVCLRHFCQDE